MACSTSNSSHNIDKYFETANRPLVVPGNSDTPEMIAKRLELSNNIKSYAHNLCSTIIMSYENIPIPDDCIFFGKTTNIHPMPCNNDLLRFALHPATSGSIIVDPPYKEALFAKQWIARAHNDIMDRYIFIVLSYIYFHRRYLISLSKLCLSFVFQFSTWIVHDHPRRVHIRGLNIRKCMIGSHAMEHELCSLLFRRLSQMHGATNNDASYMRWSKLIKPDFAV
jgi:hypothetical protein